MNTSYDPNRILKGNCGCHSPSRALAVAESVVHGTSLYERVRPRRARGTEPIVLIGASKGSQCRPFLKVEKDATLFAACNTLADEIGPINTPKKAFKLINEAIGNEVNEVFGVVTLDLHLRMKSIAETGRGEPDSVMAPMVPTLQAALIDGAHAVILFHCHPSGVKAEPSDADKQTTKAFVKAFETCNVHFIDHVITGGSAKKKSYYSFAEDDAL
jgi:DNA repair protein RadC